MGTTVVKVTPNELKEAATYYQNYIVPNSIPYTAFFARKNGITITAYTSGKIMFQGNNEKQEAEQWQKETEIKTSEDNRLPAGFSKRSIIGSDEVGNGSYFGPLVVCAVYADKKQLPLLKQLGVKDSKMLTDQQILQLAPKIKKEVNYKRLVVLPEKYNQIQPRYNAVAMKVALHNQCIHLLLKQIKPLQPEGILIDQFVQETSYRKYLKREKNLVTENLYFITKGEQYHLAVAAASIICRAEFLEVLSQESSEVGINLASGAGKKSDLQAAEIIKKGGIELLGKYAKLHFKNTEKAIKIVNAAT